MTRSPVFPFALSGWLAAGCAGRQLAWHNGLWEGRYSALYLKVLGATPAERVTLILLANSEGLQRDTRFDEPAIERSAYATAVLATFIGRSTR